MSTFLPIQLAAQLKHNAECVQKEVELYEQTGDITNLQMAQSHLKALNDFSVRLSKHIEARMKGAHE